MSRRIGEKQLGIPLNPEFGGEFVLRKRGQKPVRLGDLTMTILGPTQAQMDTYEKTWNAYLDDKADYIKRLQKRHRRSEGDLRQDDLSDVLDAALEASLTLSRNQIVTPPNMASIVMLVEEGDQSILLTGDADDTDIIEGLEKAGKMDEEGRIHVSALKVPHHGAHNSYSDELAARVTADNYLFCGDGAHTNPELDVIDGYLNVLFEGVDGSGPALPEGMCPTFWFNDGPAIADERYKEHWERVDALLDTWKDRLGRRVNFKLMARGHSFLVR
ncbi:MAG: hypothetical protein WBA51_11365 [Erythrobacter sp.]